MNAILIRVAEETIANEIGTSMRDETIAFHLSHAQTTISGTTFQWLASEHGHWTTCT
jgi:hypothetical protein